MQLNWRTFTTAAAVLLVLCAALSCTKNAPAKDPGPEDPDPDKEASYEIGDVYDNGFIKGMVFQIDEDGIHGTIIALDDTTTVWSYAVEEAMYSLPSDGLSNTRSVYRMPDWRKNYPAFVWCSKKNVMGIDKWFIPNCNEIASLYAVYSQDKEGFNAMLEAAGGTGIRDEVYWTSEEVGPRMATPFDMANGVNIEYPSEMEKTLTYSFRAFCRF